MTVEEGRPRVRSGERLLFIGDSITECLRETVAPPLGGGYVQFTYCFLTARHPEVRVEFVNRGIDGETILDLEHRWERDVIDERPDWLFVMIGVNDLMYRKVDPARAVEDGPYEGAYRRLLERTRAALSCRIVLMDPTPLEEFLPAESQRHVRRLADIVGRLAGEYGCEHVRTYDALYDAIARDPERGWYIDVPHPRLPGHAVIALAVLEHLGW